METDKLDNLDEEYMYTNTHTQTHAYAHAHAHTHIHLSGCKFFHLQTASSTLSSFSEAFQNDKNREGLRIVGFSAFSHIFLET